MTIKKTREYPFIDNRTGKEKNMRVTYRLIYNDNNNLVDVLNEYGYSVEKNSEVWEEFSKVQ